MFVKSLVQYLLHSKNSINDIILKDKSHKDLSRHFTKEENKVANEK